MNNELKIGDKVEKIDCTKKSMRDILFILSVDHNLTKVK